MSYPTNTVITNPAQFESSPQNIKSKCLPSVCSLLICARSLHTAIMTVPESKPEHEKTAGEKAREGLPSVTIRGLHDAKRLMKAAEYRGKQNIRVRKCLCTPAYVHSWRAASFCPQLACLIDTHVRGSAVAFGAFKLAQDPQLTCCRQPACGSWRTVAQFLQALCPRILCIASERDVGSAFAGCGPATATGDRSGARRALLHTARIAYVMP